MSKDKEKVSEKTLALVDRVHTEETKEYARPEAFHRLTVPTIKDRVIELLRGNEDAFGKRGDYELHMPQGVEYTLMEEIIETRRDVYGDKLLSAVLVDGVRKTFPKFLGLDVVYDAEQFELKKKQ